MVAVPGIPFSFGGGESAWLEYISHLLLKSGVVMWPCSFQFKVNKSDMFSFQDRCIIHLPYVHFSALFLLLTRWKQHRGPRVWWKEPGALNGREGSCPANPKTHPAFYVRKKIQTFCPLAWYRPVVSALTCEELGSCLFHPYKKKLDKRKINNFLEN